MTTTSSWFTCPGCGEGCYVELTPVLIDGSTGENLPLPDGIEVVIQAVPCPICGDAMLRGDPRADVIA